MNNFNCAFYIVTGKRTWGRHLVLSEAYKAAGIKPGEKDVNYIITIFLFKENTPQEKMNNVLNCFYVNDWGSISKCDGLSEEDEKDISELLIGYTYYNNEPEMKKVKA